MNALYESQSLDPTWDHRSWCDKRPLCECEFDHRHDQWLWRLIFRINKKRGCTHPHPLGKYGSNDNWCPRCGVVIGGPLRAGEM
jgi:hypothetical protein